MTALYLKPNFCTNLTPLAISRKSPTDVIVAPGGGGCAAEQEEEEEEEEVVVVVVVERMQQQPKQRASCGAFNHRSLITSRCFISHLRL